MNKLLITTLLVLTSCALSFGQSTTLDEQKYSDCRLIIPIDYKDIEKNFEESKKYADIEIVLIETNGKEKIKSFKRGFIRNWERNGKKGVYFEPSESVNAPQKAAYFPLFNDKKTFCYKADCYYSK
ncbi:hypothetical protein C3K47_02465 [Solitalea longa]|uniref:Uncharacterized protein n=1 Tax=Solitalea longa TaxID=2079460 RepID=A0A2S5AAS3_9SPHI|nr:hypothetical protein [Solitalea longa]POY39379.1 hypothetical protein C3K47_02465 [Solitalea longa]